MSIEQAQQAGLDEHNRLRALHHDTPPLVLSRELCNDAQEWADTLMSENRFDHAPRSERNGCGENIASASGHSADFVEEAIRATKSWYNELYDPGYDFGNPGWQSGAGHFTQIVWKETSELGIGIARNGRKYVTVGRYRKAGNMTNAGYFERNVLPLKSANYTKPTSERRSSPEPTNTMDINSWGSDFANMSDNFPSMSADFPGGSRSVSVETTTINGRTIEKTTVVENGVTTVTTREF